MTRTHSEQQLPGPRASAFEALEEKARRQQLALWRSEAEKTLKNSGFTAWRLNEKDHTAYRDVVDHAVDVVSQAIFPPPSPQMQIVELAGENTVGSRIIQPFTNPKEDAPILGATERLLTSELNITPTTKPTARSGPFHALMAKLRRRGIR